MEIQEEEIYLRMRARDMRKRIWVDINYRVAFTRLLASLDLITMDEYSDVEDIIYNETFDIGSWTFQIHDARHYSLDLDIRHPMMRAKMLECTQIERRLRSKSSTCEYDFVQDLISSYTRNW